MGATGTVIKGTPTARAQEQAVRMGLRPFQIDDVMREAQQAAAAARREAAKLVEEARREAGAIRQAARKEGYEAGLAEGRAAGRDAGRQEAFEAARTEFAAQQASLVGLCRQLIDELNEKRADWWAAARQDLIDLAIAIARRVARAVGQRERDVVLGNLEEAVRLAGRRSEVTIQVNPADMDAARAFAQSLTDRREHWKHVAVVESTEVSSGSCKILWGTGSVDATLETQLDRIARELSGA